eukprot:746617-Hanusia_phi.AAC.7
MEYGERLYDNSEADMYLLIHPAELLLCFRYGQRLISQRRSLQLARQADVTNCLSTLHCLRQVMREIQRSHRRLGCSQCSDRVRGSTCCIFSPSHDSHSSQPGGYLRYPSLIIY